MFDWLLDFLWKVFSWYEIRQAKKSIEKSATSDRQLKDDLKSGDF